MANDVQSGSESPSVTGLVTGIIHDAQELIKQQMVLLKHEFRDDMRKTKDASFAMAIGLLVAGIGGLLLCFMLVHLLHAAVPALQEWGAFGVVGGTFAVIGAVLCYTGKKRFDSFNPLPDETANALKENVQWIVNPK